MKRVIVDIEGMAKPLSRGIFWIVEGKLLAFPYDGRYYSGTSKSGNTYTHKKLWPDVKPKGCNKPYNYYPRGRVEINNKGRAIIYMNPNVDDSFLPSIKQEFGIREEPNIIYDNSFHYHCCLDDGWKPDN